MESSLLSRSRFHCRRWHNFGGLFDAATSKIKFKVLTYCFFCRLIVFIVAFYYLFGCLVERRKMCLTSSQ